MDMICHNGQWIVLECATRLSGGFDHMVTSPLATGRDVTKAMLDVALGGRPLLKDLSIKKNGYACAFAPILTAGHVAEWNLPEKLPGQHDIIITDRKQIYDWKHCANRTVFVIATGDTGFGALKNAVRIGKGITVEYS